MFMRWIQIGSLSLITVLFSACSNTASITHRPILSSQTTNYLQLASTENANDAYSSNLLALQNMIQNGNLNAADQLIKKLRASAQTGLQKDRLLIQVAYFQLESGQPYEAIITLGKIKRPDLFSPSDKRNYDNIKIEAHARNNQLANSLIQRLAQSQALNQNQLLGLWYQLQNLPLSTLNQLASTHRQGDIAGWLRLAVISQEFGNTNSRIANAILAWKQTFPNHPAQQFTPTDDELKALQNNSKPQQIAILLPSQGALSGMSEAIRDGILNAYFKQNQRSRISLRFYDTSQGSIGDIYRQAINHGANVVIGPLLKNNVSDIASDASVPTIALNYSDSNGNNLIQFGISPAQEAKQAAQEAWLFGVNHILTITPNSPWGQNLLAAFTQQWQQPDASIVGQLAFQSNDMKTQIASLLGISDSEARADTVKSVVRFAKNQYTQFIPRRRQDFNGIFLAGTAAEAKTILPLLRFYFIGNIPVFATSSIYHPGSSQDYNQDLNSIYFCDMPLMLSQSPAMINRRLDIKKLWPKAYDHYARFFAIGIDSYLLAEHISRLQTLPYFGLQGVTGRLYLHPNNRIYRQLDWAKMVNGQPQILK